MAVFFLLPVSMQGAIADFERKVVVCRRPRCGLVTATICSIEAVARIG
jgi:hypothetical protein